MASPASPAASRVTDDPTMSFVATGPRGTGLDGGRLDITLEVQAVQQ